MYAKLFKPTELKEGSDAKITLFMKFVGGSEYTYIYEHPYRSYESIYYELQRDYHRHTTENIFTIRFFGVVENKNVNKAFKNFEEFLSFLKDHNLMEKELLERREYIYL
jgi:hypothetical protein